MRRFAFLSLTLSILISAPAAAAPTLTEYSAGATGVQPLGMTVGDDGNVWFTEDHEPASVRRITTAGTVTAFPVPTTDAKLGGITSAGGALWFVSPDKDLFGRVTTSGVVTEWPMTQNVEFLDVATGPDGNLWVTDKDGDGSIWRITPSAVTTEYTGLVGHDPADITRGPDNRLWFTEPSDKRIGAITTQGAITEYSVSGDPRQVTAGPDGNLWFTQQSSDAIGRMTPSGVVTYFTAGLAGGAKPHGITAGTDGNIYFTDEGNDLIGQVTMAGVITTYASGLTANARLRDITTGPDGNLWFAENDKAKVGKVTVAPGTDDVSASAVADTTATLRAPVRPNAQATTYTLEWGIDQTFATGSASGSAGNGASWQFVSANVSGLAPNTTYYARVRATNATGTTYGPTRTFTTTPTGAASATTDAPTGIAAMVATLNGTVNPRSIAGIASYQFQWGTTTGYGNVAPVSFVNLPLAIADNPVSESLTGLQPNTTYHYRVVAQLQGLTTYGDDATFTTAAVAPDAVTGSANSVSADGATLAANVNPLNSATTYRFEFGETTAYGSSSPSLDQLVGDDNAGHGVTRTLGGLDPNTTYHFRVVATNDAGVTYGADQTFTTSAVAPVAETVGADAVTQRAATLRGTVNPRKAATTYWFEWGPTTDYGDSTAENSLPAERDPRAVSAALTGLKPGTTYHARLVARSDAGTRYGQDHAFRTADEPAPERGKGGGALPSGLGDLLSMLKPGKTVLGAVDTGTVRIKAPGSDEFVELDSLGTIPSGATIDARKGTVQIVSALDGAGNTQSATFWGAVFTVYQRTQDKGYVDIDLRQSLSGCPTRGKIRASIARKKKHKNKIELWGKDSHGKYRTRGRNSVATVRGTEWKTTETCRGTETRVKSGAVSVFDRRTRRHVLVKAGKRYLARPRR